MSDHRFSKGNWVRYNGTTIGWIKGRVGEVLGYRDAGIVRVRFMFKVVCLCFEGSLERA